MNSIFLEQMKSLLKEDYESYLECMKLPAYRGFRINTLKCDESSFFALSNFKKQESGLSKDSYLYLDSITAGNTPLYHAGLFYMHEPSASAPVQFLDIDPGMNILDLCAAPGSKSTQIAEWMKGEGLLVSNEIHPKRASILLENIERHGITNCVVTNASPDQLVPSFHGYFDRILCDVPCSGEGMFRKNPKAEKEWSLENIQHCGIRQKEILHSAYQMLRPGGKLLYTTCTLNIYENEERILWFQNEYPDMKRIELNTSIGRPSELLKETRKIFPMDGGEGQFMCLLQKEGDEVNHMDILSPENNKLIQEMNALLEKPYPYYFVKENKIYGGTTPFLKLEESYILRNQVFLGEWNHNQIEPSYACAMSSYCTLKEKIELNDQQSLQYLSGNSLKQSYPKGYYCVTWNGYPIGLVKSDGSNLKNKLPKSYRMR